MTRDGDRLLDWWREQNGTRLTVTYSVERDEPPPPRWDWLVVVAYVCVVLFIATCFYALASLLEWLV